VALNVHGLFAKQQTALKSPTIFRFKGFRFYFLSREESRKHIHVSNSDGEAKFWLEPEIELALNIGLSSQQIRESTELIIEHKEEILNAWREHFDD